MPPNVTKLLTNCYANLTFSKEYMRVFLTISLLTLTFCGLSQEVQLVWNDNIRQGERAEVKNVLNEDGDMYVMCSFIQPNSHHIKSTDILIRKYNENNELIWEKVLASDGDETTVKILKNRNGGIILLITSNSHDGLFNSSIGRENIYMIFLSEEGEITDKAVFGGEHSDLASDIIQLADGGFLLISSTFSQGIGFEDNHGQKDLWLLRLDNQAQIVWTKIIGGSESEQATQILTDETNIYILGTSTSFDGDFNLNFGDQDIFVMKLNMNGDLIWNYNYGGSYDEIASQFVLSPDGNILVCATSFSEDHDVEKNLGGADIWLFKLDSFGEIVFQKTIGDEKNEVAVGFQVDKEKVNILGTTTSENDQTDFSTDVILITFDLKSGSENLIRFGGDRFELPNSFILDNNGNMIIAGMTNSTEGIINSTGGGFDGFVAKLSLSELTTNELELISAYPNPFTDRIYLNGMTIGVDIDLYDFSGKEVDFSVSRQLNTTVIDPQDIPSGVYILRLEDSINSRTIKLIKP